MMTEAWNDFHVLATPGNPRSSPPKRSFDVAFLTGIKETALSDNSLSKPSSRTLNKIPKTDDLTSPGAQSPRSVETSNSQFRSSEGKSSAFTKVQKSQVSPSSSPYSEAFENSLGAASWNSSSFSAMSSLLGNKSLSPLMGSSSFLPLVPLLSHTAAAMTSDCMNNNLVEEYLKSQHEQLMAVSKSSSVRRDISPTEALSRLRCSMIPPTNAFKHPFSYGGPSKSSSSSFLSQSSVSALIPPTMTPLSLPAQNVCAKCNISFRMTSDLVYHMRSQHKREQDPYKKRRNEKLKCPICGESFRERHHLTRHMTAHQDRAEEAPTSAIEK